ncbi:GIP protein, partial [Alopecoenas beccarii]|nr:GIP protein [Alopecoenas beccarii]
LSVKVLPLLLASLGFVLMEDNVLGAPSARPVHRRYSEATLASDYSRTMDTMLKKNFVEWLLARREKKSDNIIEPYKREAEPQVSAANGQKWDLGTQEPKDLLPWLLRAQENPGFTSPEGSEGLKDVLNQEFLTWLMSTDLCRAT